MLTKDEVLPFASKDVILTATHKGEIIKLRGMVTHLRGSFLFVKFNAYGNNNHPATVYTVTFEPYQTFWAGTIGIEAIEIDPTPIRKKYY